MWKPSERIKYQAIESQWPTFQEAAASKLYSSINIGPLSLTQRTWVPAMVPWRSNEQGEVTEEVIQWYRRFAEGKPGVIVVEATGVRDIPSGPLLRIGSDTYIPGLRKVVDAVREASDGETRLFIQLIDFLPIRRRPDPEKFLKQFLPITDHHLNFLQVEDESKARQKLLTLVDDELIAVLTAKEWENLQSGYRERITDMHLPQIENLPEVLPGLFANAARRAQEAGFDGVELHYAHAYTMASFLSATNTRIDGYGGSRENRVKLPLEVYRAVRQSVGDSMVVGCRYLSDEIIEYGSRVDDACYFGQRFAEAGMDFLSLSRGGKFDDAKQPKKGWAAYPYTGRSGYECMPGYISDKKGPFGRNIDSVSVIREALRKKGFKTPIVLTGGIYSFNQSEELLQKDKADIIGLARQALADPDWFTKVRLGKGAEVNICRYSNYCEGLDSKHKQVTCELWDRQNLDEANISKSSDGRRRLIAPAWKPTK